MSEFKYARPELLGRWPAARAEADARATLHLIREADWLWSMDRGDCKVLTGIMASTEHLTAGACRISPAGRSDIRQHGGAMGLYVRKGRLNILIEEPDQFPVWFELHPGDGFYIPPGTRYRACNMGTEEVDYLWGVAPDYGMPAG